MKKLLVIFRVEPWNDHRKMDEFRMVTRRERVDILALMSLDDPSFWVRNTIENASIPVDKNKLFHHGLHALALKNKADEIGLECQAYIPPLNVDDPAGDSAIEFMLDRLNVN